MYHCKYRKSRLFTDNATANKIGDFRTFWTLDTHFGKQYELIHFTV